MSRRANRWQAAICEQLKRSGTALSTDQILTGLETSGFQHKSAKPRQTLGARLAELVAEGALERVGTSSYRLISDSQAGGAS